MLPPTIAPTRRMASDRETDRRLSNRKGITKLQTCARSSAGQSIGLLSRGSQVRVLAGALVNESPEGFDGVMEELRGKLRVR